MYIMLPNRLTKNPFSFAEAVAAGVSRRTLQGLLEQGDIEKLERGIYCVCKPEGAVEDEYKAATLIVGPKSAICLLSALSHYGLTDIIPKQIWVMTEVEKRTKAKSVRLVRKRSPKWEIGIVKESGYRITSLERTVIDTLTSPTPGLSEGINALKTSLRQKLTTPAKLSEMANKLRVYDRVFPYLRAAS
jgi:predicted transcriptional regulator of viral defense system